MYTEVVKKAHRITQLLFIASFAACIVLFSPAYAQNVPAVPATPNVPAVPAGQPATNQPATPSTQPFSLNITLQNPLKVSTIESAIQLFMSIIIKLAIPVIILFFLLTGVRYVLALGNPTEIAKVHKMFLYTLIGTLLILGAWTITNAIVGTVNDITSTTTTSSTVTTATPDCTTVTPTNATACCTGPNASQNASKCAAPNISGD